MGLLRNDKTIHVLAAGKPFIMVIAHCGMGTAIMTIAH